MMERRKLQLAYDRTVPDEELVWSILSQLGHKRSETIQLLILHIVRRYGAEVLLKSNLSILKYLLDKDAEENTPMKKYWQETEEKTETQRADAGKPDHLSSDVQQEMTQSISKDEANPDPMTDMPTEGVASTTLPRQQLSMTGKEGWDENDASDDEMRRNFLNYLKDGFYDQQS